MADFHRWWLFLYARIFIFEIAFTPHFTYFIFAAATVTHQLLASRICFIYRSHASLLRWIFSPLWSRVPPLGEMFTLFYLIMMARDMMAYFCQYNSYYWYFERAAHAFAHLFGHAPWSRHAIYSRKYLRRYAAARRRHRIPNDTYIRVKALVGY